MVEGDGKTERKKRDDEAPKGSEERYRRLVEASPDAVVVHDGQSVIYANAAAARLLGAPALEDLVGRPVLSFVHPDDRETVASRVRGILRGGEGAPLLEERYLRLDGGVVNAEVAGRPITYEGRPAVQAILRDVTERKRAEEALRESEGRFRQLFERSVDALFVLHPETREVVDCNREACRSLGYSREELLALRLEDFACEVLSEEEKERRGPDTPWRRALAGESGTIIGFHENEHRRKDGTTFPVEVGVGSIDHAGRRMILASARDATERKRAEEERTRWARQAALRADVSAAVAESAELGTILDKCARAMVRHLDASFARVWLLDREEDVLVLRASAGSYTHLDGPHGRVPVGRSKIGLIAEERRPHLTNDVLGDGRIEDKGWARREGMTAFAGYPLIVEGRLVGVAAMFARRPLAEDSLEALASVADTIAQGVERKVLGERLEHQAFHDLLTGLPNRQLFVDRLEQALRRTGRRGERKKVAVLFMDLDDFKVVNDSLGHEIGDRLLVAVGERLGGCLRPEDTLARFGGDEFTVMVDDIEHPADAVRVAERIMDAHREPFGLGGQEFFVKPSIGIALGDARTTSPEDLLRDADTAMYRAKGEKGLGGYRVFEPVMYEEAVRRLKLENDLRKAIERDELRVLYQPVYSLELDCVVATEALLRWEQPERGTMLPAEFIPLAEETGLIVPVGRWVLEEACRQAKAWQERRASDPPLIMGVNLSLRQFRDPGLAGDVARILRETGLEPATLALEITESVAMHDVDSTVATLEKLKSLGVWLVIDDFGTSNSSLSYITGRFKMDHLKIDGSFVREFMEDPDNPAILPGLIDFAHAVGLRVIAEGVETADQLRRLKEMGCELVQGNHIAEPLAPAAASELLLARKPSSAAQDRKRRPARG